MEIIKDESNYNVVDWWKKVVFENYANFKGRARRSEYWYFALGQLLLNLCVLILGTFVVGGLNLGNLAPIFGFFMC